ncbi:MAG TPA: transcriptional repressor LexA [Ktedonobacteraceae bacterium]
MSKGPGKENTSEIQQRIYEFIVQYMREEGMPPTNREIGTAMKIASTGHVDYHLTMLEKKNMIERESKKSRGIRLKQPLWGIRVLGSIAAGEPLDVFTETDAEVIEAGRELEQQGAYALVVRGQSMIEDHICDRDYVVIKPQSTCENGDIVVAVHMQGGNGQATLKRFYQEKEQNRVRLQPANSTMNPIFVPKTQWDKEWQIQGKVVAIFRKCYAA